MYVFSFKAQYDFDGESRVEMGLLTAENFKCAMEKLDFNYGDDIERIELEMIDSGEVIIIPDGYSPIIDKIKENAIW